MSAGSARRLVLLPGMDGTGLLFGPFIAAAPATVELEVVPLPVDLARYDVLLDAIAPRVAVDPSTVLLAESFSGPLALRLAAESRPAALVLVNSFVQSPVPASLRRFARPMFFRIPPPARALRRFLLGDDAESSLVDALRGALREVAPKVLAERVAAIATLDASADLARVDCPILYLRGTHDRLVGEASVQRIVEQAPRVEVQRVDGPHLLLQARPAEAWRALERFLEALPRG